MIKDRIGEDGRGMVIIAMTIIVIVTAGLVMVYLHSRRRDYDEETLCRKYDDPACIVLIDKTDPWTRREGERLAAELRKTGKGLALFERLSIHIMDNESGYHPVTVFDMCNPGRGDQVSAIYLNPRRIEKKFVDSFQAPLDRMIQRLKIEGEAKFSPIAESIACLREPERSERLIIFSDMMQHSDMVSFYGRNLQGTERLIGKILEICQVERPYDKITVYLIHRPEIPFARMQRVKEVWRHVLPHIAKEVSWKYL